MGNYSVIVALGVAVVILAVIMAGMRSMRVADESLDDYHYKVVAREGATTGINLALGALARDTASWAADPSVYAYLEVPYSSAVFTVDVLANYGPTIRTGKCNIDSVDVVSNGVSGGESHVVEATIVRTCRDSGGAPGTTMAVASEQQFLVNGESMVFHADPTKNANIHSNDELYIDGDPYVEGYGTYTGSYHCDPSSCPGFVPNDDVNGPDPNVFYADSMHIPTFVAADYYAQATYVQGPQSLNGGIIDFTNYQGITTHGTVGNPFLWYIQGDLEVEGDVQFLGYAMIVVEGHVHINGDATILSSVASGNTPPESTYDNPNKDEVRQWISDHVSDEVTLGIYVEGSKDDKPDEAGIHINSNAIVAGHLFANHKIHLNGDATVFGGMITKNQMHMNGKNVTWYLGLNDAVNLFGPNITLPEGIRLIAYAEW